jgi:succinate dehydrogenase / fumarate reductase membrane anchor subunit
MQATVPAPESARRSPVEGAGLELWSWYFFRVSGLLLVFLALGHLLIMHVLNSVDTIDYDWVAARWRSVGWRVYDWLLLALALPHGMNGLRVVIDDYVHSPRWRPVARTALWSLFIIFMALGTWTIAVFEPRP